MSADTSWVSAVKQSSSLDRSQRASTKVPTPITVRRPRAIGLSPIRPANPRYIAQNMAAFCVGTDERTSRQRSGSWRRMPVMRGGTRARRSTERSGAGCPRDHPVMADRGVLDRRDSGRRGYDRRPFTTAAVSSAGGTSPGRPVADRRDGSVGPRRNRPRRPGDHRDHGGRPWLVPVHRRGGFHLRSTRLTSTVAQRWSSVGTATTKGTKRQAEGGPVWTRMARCVATSSSTPVTTLASARVAADLSKDGGQLRRVPALRRSAGCRSGPPAGPALSLRSSCVAGHAVANVR